MQNLASMTSNVPCLINLIWSSWSISEKPWEGKNNNITAFSICKILIIIIKVVVFSRVNILFFYKMKTVQRFIQKKNWSSINVWVQVLKVLPFLEHWTQNNHVDNENQNNFKMFSFASFQCVSNFPQMYVLSELFSDYCSKNPQFNLRKKKKNIQAHLLSRYADFFFTGCMRNW